MEIRSITLFCEPHLSAPETAAAFFAAARQAFALPVQSTRLATTPFPGWWIGRSKSPEPHVSRAEAFAARWQAAGADYISLGPVLLRHESEWLEIIPALLSTTGLLFAAAEIADSSGAIDIGRCRQVARLIRQVSTLLDSGFGNLYFAALANCPPGSPFFPVAYHAGGTATFAVAVEAADLALSAIQAAGSLADARANLVFAIEQAAVAITETAEALAATHGIPFSGIDFSLAPYPSPEKSLAGAMEALGLPHVGAPGSLFAAAFITEAIGRARFRRCGFSSLMLPVLEDAVLARRAGDGLVSVQDLLSYAAVCGVGLDTIPLPGDISQESLAGILLDTAALASRLNKPLTARLMPLPGLAAGDPVQFDFPYFVHSRVMAVPRAEGGGLLAKVARLQMKPNFVF